MQKIAENKAVKELNQALERIGNIVHPSVPVFNDE